VSRQERTQEVEKLKGELVAVKNAVLIDYRGITVPQVTDLRAQVRKGGGSYAVIKNTLLARAVEGAPLAKLKDHMRGPTALLWSDAEPVRLAKTISAFVKSTPVVQVKALLLDGEPLAAERLEMVASLPSREELRARVVGLLASPLRRFVTVMSGPSRGLASVLKQKAEKTQS